MGTEGRMPQRSAPCLDEPGSFCRASCARSSAAVRMIPGRFPSPGFFVPRGPFGPGEDREFGFFSRGCVRMPANIGSWGNPHPREIWFSGGRSAPGRDMGQTVPAGKYLLFFRIVRTFSRAGPLAVPARAEEATTSRSVSPLRRSPAMVWGSGRTESGRTARDCLPPRFRAAGAAGARGPDDRTGQPGMPRARVARGGCCRCAQGAR